MSLLTPVRGGVLFNQGADWQWRKGTSEPSSPTTGWRQPGFSASGWQTGPAPFFYGENLVPGTVITDMRNNYSTLYLRRHFTVTDLDSIATLDLDVRCDDGFLAWINGKQVAGKNPPAVPTFNSFATQAAGEPAEFETYRLNSPANLLVEGENVIAIQMFNVSLSSSDLVFDAQLFTTERETDPPTLIGVSPFPGTVTNLTEISVTFSEPVQGVDAADLRINDRPAQSVRGSGAAYTFSFQQPAFGSVQIAWSLDANIQDQAVPPNPFDIHGPESRFVYDLVDASYPLVAAVHPPTGKSVSRLTEIQLYFTKPVQGVDAADLLVNQSPAASVTGTGAGPYLFRFAQPADGPVQVSWAENHQITDFLPEPRVFENVGWTYSLDSEAALPPLRISEISAANMTGLRDEDGSAEDWIEIQNFGDEEINLGGWSLSDDPDNPGAWVFPPVTIHAGGYLVVFASGKDRREVAGNRLHTNFKLSLAGEYLGLFTPDSPRRAASEFAPAFPVQRNDFSYGYTADGSLRYFSTPTPGAANGGSAISGVVAPVEFTVKRGFFQSSFDLGLYSTTPGAVVRYTLDGTEPTETTGLIFTGPVRIDRTRMVRAAAFKPGSLPSLTETHTYLFNLPASRRLLPAMSLVTAANNLYGATGIMEVNPRNTIHHGMAWERPVSVEYIRPNDNEGFQIDCGIRIQGGGYVRERYDYRTSSLPFSKYSYRLYFRGDYGAGKLNYPLFPGIPLDSFDEVVLRAGMNDHSNPFIRDELARALSADLGCVASHGTFVNLFLNGVYKGVYNPTERIGWKFLQQWHGGGEDWDLIAQSSEIREGDAVAWNALRGLVVSQSPALPATYLEISKRMDLANFIDYLLAHIYADTDDWPHNNWRAARERTPEGKFRFYIWDAEWSFGYNNGPSHNTIVNQLSSLSPPWGSTEIQQLFTRLKLSPEFRLLWADRVHKHFFNGGALTDERIRARYEQIRNQVASSISGFDNTIGNSWIPQRRRYVTNHFAQSGLLASSNAPVFSQFGGTVPAGFQLEMTAPMGTIYYTTNGVDPRVPFSAEPHESARIYNSPLPIAATHIKARTLSGSEWSALTEAGFEVERLGFPVRITEIMYHAIGGDEFEFIELQNTGGSPVSMDGITVAGIDYRFPENGTVLEAGARIIIASGSNPALFAQRYPGVEVFAHYAGTLSNGGERLALEDASGNVLTQLFYDDEAGWPTSPDGSGYSLEMVSVHGSPESLSNWQASKLTGGTPGAPNSQAGASPVLLNEVMTDNVSAVAHDGIYPDWVELRNTSDQAVDISGWSLTDDSNPRRFVFPAGTVIEADEHLVVWCGPSEPVSGLVTSFGLSRRGESVFLYDASTNRVDAITWGPQVADFSIGRTGEGWSLAVPTPGLPNEMAPIASQSDVRVNELMANPLPGEPDWIELHNSNSLAPAAVGRFYLGTSGSTAEVGPLSFIPPGGFLQLYADELPGADHLHFKLPANGETIVLHDPAGTELDRVTYPAQVEGASYGRLPDGAVSWKRFPVSASPGTSNYIPEYQGPVINEILAYNTAGLDWVELHNPTAEDFDLGGMSLSLNRRSPGEWQFLPGTTIPAGGYLLLECDPLLHGGGQIGQSRRIGPGLNNSGGGVYLFNQADQLVEFREYGFQIQGTSIGWASTDWTLLSTATPGATNGSPANLGSPLELKINEWMAAPVAGDDWFEIYNSGDLPVALGGLYITDDPSIHGRTNTRIPELTFVAPKGFVLFQADGEVTQGPDHVGFNLSSLGETIRLYSSTFAVLDEVNFAPQPTGTSEGRIPDGGTEIVLFPGAPTPASPNVLPGQDSDGDGMPDDWEALYGLNPAVPDGDEDHDGDGISNANEYLAGTDPSDPSSSVSLMADWSPQAGGVILEFSAAPNRSYTIFYTEELGAEGWSRLENIEAASEPRQLQVIDSGASRARFYRLVTPLQP